MAIKNAHTRDLSTNLSPFLLASTHSTVLHFKPHLSDGKTSARQWKDRQVFWYLEQDMLCKTLHNRQKHDELIENEGTSKNVL